MDRREFAGEELVPDEQIQRSCCVRAKSITTSTDERESAARTAVQLLRMEQIYPFPEKSLMWNCRAFPKAEIVWCQKSLRTGRLDLREPAASEAVAHSHRPDRAPAICGAHASASPATGLMSQHHSALTAFAPTAAL